MFSAVGFSQPANGAATVRQPSKAQARATPRPVRRFPRRAMLRTRPFSQKAMGAGMLGTRGSERQGNRHRTGPAALLVPAGSDNVRARMFHSRDPRRQLRVGGRGAGPGGKTRRGGWPLATLLAAAALATVPRSARAVPIDDPDIGGIGFSGPTTGDLAAGYWNPAAPGPIHGGQGELRAPGPLAPPPV